ncbi:MAG: hypothetical protein NW226_23030 [Microscillaceae bacterium]|nr:hypothetical protein [Microscillaceae bacterium]
MIQLKKLFLAGLLCQCLSMLGAVYAQVQVIQLTPELIQLNQRDFYIAEVIDQRVQQDMIGFVQKGMMNKRVLANLEQGVAKCLMNYFNWSLPKKEDTHKAIILAVYQLYIGEKTGMFKETGWAKVSLGFGIKENGIYKELFKIHAQVENNGLDVTAAHPNRIKKAILQCLEGFASQTPPPLESAAMEEDTEKIEEMPVPNFENMDSPYAKEADIENSIFTCTSRKKGVYKNFDEFIHNNPSTLDFRVGLKEGFYAQLYDLQNKRLKDAYGFCDGENLYINTSLYSMKKDFVKVLEVGRYIAWLDQYLDNDDIVINGFYPYAMSMNRMDVDCILMTYDAGVIVPLNKSVTEQILHDDPELSDFYQSISLKKDAMLQIELIKKYNKKHPVK